MTPPPGSPRSVDNKTSGTTILPIHERLTSGFRSNRLRSLESRKQQLRQLRKGLSEMQKELCHGVAKDLGKGDFQGWLTEVQVVDNSAYHALHNLDHWARAEKKETNLFNVPATSEVVKEPRGVVLILAAWNFNILLSLQPLVGAIAAGNCAVVKPGSWAVKSSEAIVKLIRTYLDPECFEGILGDRHVTSELLEHRWDLVFFTGSKSVGKIVLEKAAGNLTPCVLELGGKSPAVIEASAPMETTARRIAWGATLNAGQACVRPDYILVHENAKSDFLLELKKALHDFLLPNAKESEHYGRIIDRQSFQRISDLMDDAQEHLYSGGQVDGFTRFIEPSIYLWTNLSEFRTPKMMQEEVFGPLIPICIYETLDDALEFIREGEQPLSAYFFGDKIHAQAFIEGTSSGSVVINDCMVNLSNESLPFGGVGSSGMGRYHGEYSFQTFSHEKAVLRRRMCLDPSLRYPPYTIWRQRLLRLLTKPIFQRLFSKLSRLLSYHNALYALLCIYFFVKAKKIIKTYI